MQRVEANCDFRALARQALEKCLKRTLSGRIHLHIPASQGPLRPTPGKHFHLMPELFLQLAGVNNFELPNERFRLLPGELCIIPRGMPHNETVQLRQGCFAMFVFQYVDIHGLQFIFSGGKQGQHPYPIKYITISYPRIIRTAEYLEDIIQISQAGRRRNVKIGRWLLSAHLAELMTILETAPVERRGDSEPFKITRAKQIVANNANDPKLNVHKLEEMMHCSADYLSHLFHSRTGVTLNGYINHYRISQARYLLQNTTMNIKEIAYTVGFVDPDYFSRLFRAMTGQPPGRYRRLFLSPAVSMK